MDDSLGVLERVKLAGERTRAKWPGDSDAEKASRAIEAYELGYLPLRRLYSRKNALLILDSKGQQMFGVSERHIRRVETIREKRPTDAARLERLATTGALSLELVEWIVLHPPSADVIEAIFLVASPEAQQQFLVRLGL